MLRRALPLLLILALPSPAHAKSWKGIKPNESKRGDVLSAFGEPKKKMKGTKEILAYTGDQAISGTSQAQFLIKEDGTVEQIIVFPKTTLEVSEVEDMYGKACSDKEANQASCYTKQVDDEFRVYYWYKKQGLVVFFGDDKKTVASFIFNAPVNAK